MRIATISAAVLAFVLSTGVALATNMTISTNTSWSGTVNIDGTISFANNAILTVQPGTVVNFVNSSANLHLTNGGLNAAGTAAQPIYFTGSSCGLIDGAAGKGVAFDHCVISGLGGPSTGTSMWFSVNPAQGLSITNSTLSNCSRLQSQGSAGATISNCTLTNMGYSYLMNNGGNTFTNCKVNGAGAIRLYSGSGTKNEASYNVMVNSLFYIDGTATVDNVLVHDNYIHDYAPAANNAATQECLEYVVGQVYNNVIRGGGFGMVMSGGHVYNNVLESMSAAEKAARGDGTHEQTDYPTNNSAFEHNLFLGTSYASIATGSTYLGTNCVFRNNTFDQRGTVGVSGVAPFYLNHLHSGSGSNMNIRNNLFLRTGRFDDEASIANTISYVDYNSWAGRIDDSFGGASTRFAGVYITGKTEGDDGFGMHDVTLPMLKDGYNPASLVQNPDFVDPYTDAQMLAGTYTTSQLLALYQQAYTPVAGSSIIDAGSPADSSDPLKIGSRIDIGAIEAPLPVATYLPGDFNKDHVVDYHDYLILEGSFGKSGMTWEQGDANNDSLVDYHDYIVLEQNFGKTAPEPVTLSLLATGAVALLRRRT